MDNKKAKYCWDCKHMGTGMKDVCWDNHLCNYWYITLSSVEKSKNQKDSERGCTGFAEKK